jgi:UDP-glucose 4-epimerase
MRALVTGGAGFIGSALVERLLASDYEVDVVDDLSTGSIARLARARGFGRAFSFHQLDICQSEFPALVAQRRPEIIFHLAALTGPARSLAGPARDAEVSLIGTLRLLEGALIAGSTKIVMTVDEELAAGRTTAAAPSAHGIAELAALDYLTRYRVQHGLEYSALALGCVYGPGHGDQGPVARLAAALAEGRTPAVRDGDAFDLVYLDDVVDALVRAGQRGSGVVLPIGTGTRTAVRTLVAELSALCGRDGAATPRSVATPSPAGLDPSRARLHLGWTPFTELGEGLRAVVSEMAPIEEARAG